MPISSFLLDNIPPEMVLQVVSKVPATTLVNLHQTNKTIQEVCECRRTWAYRDIPMITVTCKGIQIYLDNEKSITYKDIPKPVGLPISLRCSVLTLLIPLNATVVETIRELMTTLKIKFHSLCVLASLIGNSQAVHELFQLVKPYKINVKGYLRNAISPSVFQQLAIVHIEGTEYPVSTLCHIKVAHLTVRHSELTSEDCNIVIQNWYERPRRIRLLETHDLNVTVVTAGIPVSLIYNKESHQHSILRRLNQSKFDDSIKTFSFFMLIKPDDLSEMSMLIVGPNSLEIVMPCENPKNILFPLLTRLSHVDYARFATEYCTSCRNHNSCHCSCYSRSM